MPEEILLSPERFHQLHHRHATLAVVETDGSRHLTLDNGLQFQRLNF